MDLNNRSVYFSLNKYREKYHTHPYPSTLSNKNESASGSSITTTTIISGSDTDFTGDSITGLTLVSSDTVNATNINANQITTTTLNVSIIDSSFTTTELSDITFLGSTPDNKIVWDATNDIFYIDAKLKISDSSITLNDDPDIVTLTSSDNEDKGFFFKWYDTSEKLGFMGFDISSQRFKIYSDCTKSAGAVSSGTLGDFQMNKIFTNNLENYSSTDLDFNISNGDFNNILTTSNYLLDVTTGSINIKNNSLGITVDSDYSNQNAINIIAGSGGINLTSGLNTDIIMGDLNITGDSINNILSIDFDINVNSSANILNFNEANGLTVQNKKTDYKKWFPYSVFDSIMGIWTSIREIISGNPVYYWQKDLVAEITYLNIDLTEVIRETTSKGLELTDIFFYYEIENDLLNSISLSITKKTFNPGTQDKTIADIPYTNNNLLTGLGIDTHYRSISITTPFFINDDSSVSLEIAYDTKITTLLKFYGIFCNFNYNHL